MQPTILVSGALGVLQVFMTNIQIMNLPRHFVISLETYLINFLNNVCIFSDTVYIFFLIN